MCGSKVLEKGGLNSEWQLRTSDVPYVRGVNGGRGRLRFSLVGKRQGGERYESVMRFFFLSFEMTIQSVTSLLWFKIFASQCYVSSMATSMLYPHKCHT